MKNLSWLDSGLQYKSPLVPLFQRGKTRSGFAFGLSGLFSLAKVETYVEFTFCGIIYLDFQIVKSQ
jgi:hypothetical protein